MSRHARKTPRHLPRRALVLALLCTPLAVLAADPACVNPDGTPVSPASSTDQGSEYGTENATCDTAASAFGYRNNASGQASSAFGFGNNANGEFSIAFGLGNGASGQSSSAFGYLNTASGGFGSAFGTGNDASGEASSAFGLGNTASGGNSVAFGFHSASSGDSSAAFGYRSQAIGDHSFAMGGWYARSGNPAPVVDLDLDGDGTAESSSELTIADGTEAVAVGLGVRASGAHSGAFGIGSRAAAVDSLALGLQATTAATAGGSVALGAHSIADRANTVSVGTIGNERQIVNVMPGSADTDAVNLSQLYPLANALGGGASYAGGVFTAPTYMIQSGSYNDVGSAFNAVDASLADLYAKIGSISLTPGPKGDTGPAGPQGPMGPQGPAGGDPLALVYDDDTRNAATLKGTDGTVISNVADGTDAHDAVNVGQLQATSIEARAYVDTQTQVAIDAAKSYADANGMQTLNAAKAYTDQRLSALNQGFDQFRSEVNDRFYRQDERIARHGAMNAASTQMAINAAGASGYGNLAVGMGFAGGKSALSVGYAAPLGDRAQLSFGGSVSGSQSSAGIGFGIKL